MDHKTALSLICIAALLCTSLCHPPLSENGEETMKETEEQAEAMMNYKQLVQAMEKADSAQDSDAAEIEEEEEGEEDGDEESHEDKVTSQEYNDEMAAQFDQLNLNVAEVMDYLGSQEQPMKESSVNTQQKCSTCRQTGRYGGTGGRYFKDTCASSIASIQIWANSQGILGIRTRYRDKRGRYRLSILHGTTKGRQYNIKFRKGEELIAVVGRVSTNGRRGAVHQLAFLTQQWITQHRRRRLYKKVYGPYGPERGKMFIIHTTNIVGFTGRSGSTLNQIGVLYKA